MSTVTLDSSRVFQAALGDAGLPDDLFATSAEALRAAHRAVHARVAAGDLPFLRLHEDVATTDAVATWATEARAHFHDAVVLGIGGSSLGGRTLTTALGGAGMRVHFPDNLDPERFSALLHGLELPKTLFIAISKSGGTLETLAQTMIVRQLLMDRLGNASVPRHLVLVTDPEQGFFRELATAEGLTTFSVPPNVGGRFSAFTPVGLLPAALAGIDPHALMRGVAAAAEQVQSDDPAQNPALAAAAVLHAMDRLKQRRILYTVPYSDLLRPLSEWFSQLWAESLGKGSGGPTPVPAVGATDQHSQLQRWMEGSPSHVVAFVEVETFRTELTIGAAGLDAWANTHWLVGKSLGQILNTEKRATEQALTEAGQPSLTWRLPAITAESVAALMTLQEAMTAYAGELYGVNTFDQPGVEAGKIIAKRMLGA